MTDARPLQQYLEALLPVVLGADAAAVRDVLSGDAAEVADAFVRDAAVSVAFVDEHSRGGGAYRLARRPTWAPPHVSALALVKRQAVLDLAAPLSAQVRVISLLGHVDADHALLETPSEALGAVVHGVMAPWFDAYAAQAEEDDEQLGGAPLVKRKMAELELSLRHLQEHVDIPQVELPVHPRIAAVVDRGAPLPDTLDDAFVNELHANMNGWVRAVQAVARLDRDPGAGSALQEIHFWGALEAALEHLDEQLHAPAISRTLDVLTQAKRFHATVSFHADTGLKDHLERVRGYNLLLKDIPLGELHAAPTLEALDEAARAVLGAVVRKLRVSAYPVRRALALVEAMARDLADGAVRLLAAAAPMQQSAAAFHATLRAAHRALDTWDEQVKEFVYLARDLTRKRAERFIPIKVGAPHAALRARLAYLARFRRAHDELAAMADVGAARGALLGEIRGAYDAVARADVLDVSERGAAALGAAEATYNERIAHVETNLVERLRGLLADAKTARERLRVLAQFNRLFVRPRVRAAVQEHQQVLLQSVRADLDALHAKFRRGYRHSDAHVAAQLRAQPEIVGAVVWAGELERQLRMYMQRVADVLGAEWAHHAEGQRLHAESDAFLQQLDTRPLLHAWAADMTRRAAAPRGAVLRVVARGDVRRLVAAYDPHVFAFADEAHALTLHGHAVPQALASTAHDARRMYPHALSLDSALHTWQKASATAAAHPLVAPLLARAQLDVRRLLARARACRWEAFLERSDSGDAAVVGELAAAVVALEERTAHVVAVAAQVEAHLAALHTCAYTSEALGAPMAALQSVVDALGLAGLANVDAFVDAVERRVEGALQARLEDALRGFCERLDGAAGGGAVELLFAGPPLTVEPPLEAAQAHWYAALGAHMDAALAQPRLVRRTLLDVPAATHRASLLRRVPAAALGAPLRRITAALADARAHVERWLALQCLWDTEPDAVAARVGDDLRAWLVLVDRVQATRTFVDGAPRRVLALAVVDASNVQARVAARLDAWQAALHAHLAARLGAAMRDVHATMAAGRAALEPLSASAAATAHVVALVTQVAELAQAAAAWAPQAALFADAQRVLQRLRVRLPDDWLYAEQVLGELGALRELLAQKRAAIDAQHEHLQLRLAAEERGVDERTAALVAAWQAERPDGARRVADALAVCGAFEERAAALSAAAAQLARARDAFGLAPRADSGLAAVVDEVRELKDVWAALAGVAAAVDELRAIPWAAVQPRAVRQRLEGLVRECRAMPSRLRAYAAYEAVVGEVQRLAGTAGLLAELAADAFRARHWRALHQRLGAPRYVAASHTLGAVWALDCVAHAREIRAAIAEAQGEYALEVYLQGVRDAWTGYALELVNYRHECMLLRGFDAIFQLAAEHGAGLRAMAASPHFRVFEEEARLWESRVARVHATFDVWVDVQRRWVYLHGVFAGNDIRPILPVESARFASLSAEFLGLLRKVHKAPYPLDVIQVPGLLQALERLAELLHKLQRALGEYLERERARFPRFYFVGDEDLLELLGHGQDVARAAKHFGKLFAGVARAECAGDDIVAVENTARERVELVAPVRVAGRAVHEWLSALADATARTLAEQLPGVLAARDALDVARRDAVVAWLASAPAQLLVLAEQVHFTRAVEGAAAPSCLAETTAQLLATLADAAHEERVRRAAEQLITLATHHAAVLPTLGAPFAWEQQLRHYVDGTRVTVRLAHTSFTYGFEMLGAHERLVQTPLTTAAYTTLTAALAAHAGGAPFGPAGTGKTETVKALGAELGRLCLVFNCDAQFDLGAMRRLLAGLARVGAWGCFDEFNRLEERTLSSVSQQIQQIQAGLAAGAAEIHPHTGIFVTMNPSYAGRSHLPDNLRKLFRSVAMTRPDEAHIVEVLLRVHGFRSAPALAAKVVLLFRLCAEQLSDAPHYDFGLRALKAVLVRAGAVRRSAAEAATEAALLVQSVHETVLPRLVAEDTPLFGALVADVFPGVAYAPAALTALREALAHECAAAHLGAGAWLPKVLQLHQVLQVACGVVLVGAAGTGKTRAWRTLLAALERVEGRAGAAYVIDAKVLSKDALFGTLDMTTREWTDGLFTQILRRILDNARRESTQRHWIVFDGDMDPEWVESLNSVLDDNRCLTLPTGERLALPDHVRLLFEVDSVAHATRATITRCGMVWFGAASVSRAMRCAHWLAELRTTPVDDEPGALSVQAAVADALAPHLPLVDRALTEAAAALPHVEAFSDARALATLGALVRRTARDILAYNARHVDFPLSAEDTACIAQRTFLGALVWAVAGDAPLADRTALATSIAGDAPAPLLDHYVEVAPGAPWRAWADAVPAVDVDAAALTTADVVVPTVDTVRQEALLHAFLADHRPVVLCGPPGSGKTMVLLAALRRLPDVDVVTLNLSSQTPAATLQRVLEAHGTYVHTPAGLCLAPRQPGRWLALFCDEINLPAPDAYATQRVLAALRQLVEQRGFWRDRTWVSLERVQFVGACNPPTDAGRTPLPPRLLRHVPIALVDYPADVSLRQIYGAMARALLRPAPSLLGYADALVRGMVAFYRATQAHFTPDAHAHYVYSPRELTRWMRGMHRLLRDEADLDELVRVWAHEAQRVFQDRLVTAPERAWSEAALDDTARAAFPGTDVTHVLRRPLLYADWLSRDVRRVDRAALRDYAAARLRGFSDEALDTDLVLHDAVLDLALRCDRVLQQPAGHLLLIGVAGSGRTTVTRFCAWLRGLSLYSVPSARDYDDARFDDDLRALLRRVGVRGERVCWTLDEAQVAHPARVERLNTLLANAEVADLFDGDEHASLLSALRDAAQRDGLVVNGDDELLAYFRAQILANLHVVLTMAPPRGGIASRAAASPALLNRCTLVYCW